MGAKNENCCSLELNNWQHQMLILNMNKNAKRYLKIMLDEMYNSYLNNTLNVNEIYNLMNYYYEYIINIISKEVCSKINFEYDTTILIEELKKLYLKEFINKLNLAFEQIETLNFNELTSIIIKHISILINKIEIYIYNLCDIKEVYINILNNDVCYKCKIKSKYKQKIEDINLDGCLIRLEPNLNFINNQVTNIKNKLKILIPNLYNDIENIKFNEFNLINKNYIIVKQLIKDIETPQWFIDKFNRTNEFITYNSKLNANNYFIDNIIYYIIEPILLKKIDLENYNFLKIHIFDNIEFLEMDERD